MTASAGNMVRTGFSGASIIVACQATQNLAFAGLALFLPLIREDLDLSFSQAGLFAVVATVSYAIMQIPAGRLADSFGPSRVFIVGVVGVSLCSILFGVLPSHRLLLGAQAVQGVFRALMFAPGLVLMSHQFPTRWRATAMSMFVGLAYVANVALNLLGPRVVERFGWDGVFVGVGLLGLTMASIFRLRFPTSAGTPRARVAGRPRVVRALLGSHVMWLCGGIQFVRLAVTSSVLSWWPTYLVIEKGLSLEMSGIVLATGAALTIPANFAGGVVADRTGRPIMVIIGALSLIAATLYLIVQASSVVTILLVVAINNFLLQVYFGPLFAIPVAVFGEDVAGSASGISNTFANVGSFAAIYMLGAVRDHFGSFEGAILVLIGLCGVAMVLAAALARTTRRRDHPGRADGVATQSQISPVT